MSKLSYFSLLLIVLALRLIADAYFGRDVVESFMAPVEVMIAWACGILITVYVLCVLFAETASDRLHSVKYFWLSLFMFFLCIWLANNNGKEVIYGWLLCCAGYFIQVCHGAYVWFNKEDIHDNDNE